MNRRRLARVTVGNAVTAFAIDVLGLTEADVRDVWMYHDRDVYVIRTWNHRRYEATGLEVYRWFQSTPLTGFEPATLTLAT